VRRRQDDPPGHPGRAARSPEEGLEQGGFLVSGPDIFISYCRPDRALARLFAESFADEGFTVWWDAVMQAGETFDEVIERNLRAAKAVLVIWSPRSVSSRWVRAEATQADRANKLVPVKIEACELPFIFELTHTADLVDWKGDRQDANWQSLVADLRRLVGPAKDKAAPDQAAEKPPAEPKAPAVAERKPEPAQLEAAGDERARAANQDELAETLERLASSRGSALLDPTPAEKAQANFFKRSDEYRQTEDENLHCLRRLHAAETEPLHMVGPDGLLIGRTAPSDIILFEPGVSREHCVVELAAGKVRVMDLNSTNGTYIDNKRIGRAEILPVGSILRVGNISFAHEVHSRAEMELLGEAKHFNPGADPLGPRIARSS
jgi:hypothetical protein